MDEIKKGLLITVFCCICFAAFPQAQVISLQSLLERLGANNELLKSGQSQVQAKQAGVKAATYDRLPQLNTMYQATMGSENNVNGPSLGMGVLPSMSGGSRAYSDINPVSGSTALAGINWEAINFGGYKAAKDLAKADLAAQNSIYAKTQYDLNAMAAAYYLELLRQYELAAIDQDNISRLRELLSTIGNLVVNGIRPGVDSSIASSELSKSLVAFYDAEKVFAQTQSQLSALTGLPSSAIIADTLSEYKLIGTGATFALGATVDTADHPDIALYSSLYGLSRARLQIDQKRFFPKIFLNADAWTRSSSLTAADQYTGLEQGYIPQRFDYFVGITMTYDIMDIVRKRLNTNVSKYASDASAHQLEQAKIDISNSLRQASIENEYQLKKLSETERQLRSASVAYGQQSNLYRNGLSSIIELDLALSYYIQARRDYLDAKVGYMRSIINYSLVTNSFNSLVQTLKL
jgi:outer membrane protein TolC